eukprot:CCRYP_004993-RA/>CCRYP_004993-RA protein AED:0.49 eAED:1.00 QI:0/0/0/1/0/0/2/0/73
MVPGKTPEISENLDLFFGELMWYWDGPHPGLNDYGGWTGVVHNLGIDICYWILCLTTVVSLWKQLFNTSLEMN